MDRHTVGSDDHDHSAEREAGGPQPGGPQPGDVRATMANQLGFSPAGPVTAADRVALATERLEVWRERPLVMFAVVAIAISIALVVPRLGRSSASGPPIEDRIPQVTLTPTTALVSSTQVVVHVSGAVRSPGVYTLDATSRVVDAIEAAGGATLDAEPHRLNLAAVVVDGEQIRVPIEGEEVAVPASVGGGPIDLNRADVVELQELPGVGPATAEAIVSHRDDNGPFRSIDDLLDVPGIGPAKLAAIADAAVVR